MAPTTLKTLRNGLVASLLMTTAAVAQDVSATIGIDVDAFNLDPRIQRDTTAYRLTDIIYSGLVTFDEDFAPVPDLATSWENPDDTTFIFHLREDATFQDGTPLTAGDVVYTFTTLLDPEMNSRYATYFSAVETVTALDDYTVEFKLSTPYAPLISYLDLGIVSQDYIEAGNDTANAPMGTGPYRLTSWEKGTSITLEAYDDYYGGAPYTDEITLDIVADNTARAQALEAGDLDIIMTPLSPQDINRLSGDDEYTHVALPGVTFEYLNFNTSGPILSDPAVRQAIAMLVDQDTIVEQIYGGVDAKANSIVLPAMAWAYDEGTEQYPFDIAAAGAALDEAGWTMGPDGVREKDGTPLAIELTTNNEGGIRSQAVEYLQNLFQQVGIQTTTDIADFSTFIAAVFAGDYDIALLSVNNIADPDRAVYLQLHSDSSLNWGGYDNAELNAAAEAGRTSMDIEARGDAYREAAEIVATDVPMYIISYVRTDAFASEEFSFFEPDARGFLRSLATGPQD